MGIELPIEKEAIKKLRRCNKIVIDSVYAQPQSIIQEYEDLIVDNSTNTILSRSSQSRINRYNINELFPVVINVDGKDISGYEVAKFFFIFNDNVKNWFPDVPAEVLNPPVELP